MPIRELTRRALEVATAADDAPACKRLRAALDEYKSNSAGACKRMGLDFGASSSGYAAGTDPWLSFAWPATARPRANDDDDSAGNAPRARSKASRPCAR